jgi:hypothetical protein
MLLRAGCDRCARTDFGHSSLHAAALRGHHDVVQLLLNEEGFATLLGESNLEGETLVDELIECICVPETRLRYSIVTSTSHDPADEEATASNGFIHAHDDDDPCASYYRPDCGSFDDDDEEGIEHNMGGQELNESLLRIARVLLKHGAEVSQDAYGQFAQHIRDISEAGVQLTQERAYLVDLLLVDLRARVRDGDGDDDGDDDEDDNNERKGGSCQSHDVINDDVINDDVINDEVSNDDAHVARHFADQGVVSHKAAQVQDVSHSNEHSVKHVLHDAFSQPTHTYIGACEYRESHVTSDATLDTTPTRTPRLIHADLIGNMSSRSTPMTRGNVDDTRDEYFCAGEGEGNGALALEDSALLPNGALSYHPHLPFANSIHLDSPVPIAQSPRRSLSEPWICFASASSSSSTFDVHVHRGEVRGAEGGYGQGKSGEYEEVFPDNVSEGSVAGRKRILHDDQGSVASEDGGQPSRARRRESTFSP